MNEFDDACLVRATLSSRYVISFPWKDWRRFSTEGLLALLYADYKTRWVWSGRQILFGTWPHGPCVALRAAYSPGAEHAEHIELEVPMLWAIDTETARYVFGAGSRFRQYRFSARDSSLAIDTFRRLMEEHEQEAEELFA